MYGNAIVIGILYMPWLATANVINENDPEENFRVSDKETMLDAVMNTVSKSIIAEMDWWSDKSIATAKITILVEKVES
jgi:hypothetical protein